MISNFNGGVKMTAIVEFIDKIKHNNFNVQQKKIEPFLFSAVVRRFSGHSAGISDLTFSHDGRWLLTSSLDATTRWGPQ